ncbi:hypothetical protein R8124_000609 [Salmonella enterica]|uniref:Uncharacterized protein n=3 Tax=Enterobacteriaceae TaxID=543 RepID=F2Q960_SALET|nr:hypothetical protein [Salmonella enterica]CAX68156.1 hypothetical protein CTnscr_042 [Salmonella enterica subsp. enterica] [Salmonella enterica subsp. enterica serovar Senftenberg]HAB1649531.1 hypothetical protein [Salmonella enterica subsp. enterica]EBY8685135.1 hypothetical protein [Salmonella enterica subsp. enterica serovar Agona]EHW1978111.1 hypothetical protein [Salmonella enterica subsp. enterica serovar Agona]EKG5011702.1 hypothetical protein [Salmonella enterica]
MTEQFTERERRKVADIVQEHLYEACNGKTLSPEDKKTLVAGLVSRAKRATGKKMKKEQLYVCWEEFYPEPHDVLMERKMLRRYDPGTGVHRDKFDGRNIRDFLAENHVIRALKRYNLFGFFLYPDEALPPGTQVLVPESTDIPAEVYNLWTDLVNNSGETEARAAKYTAVEYQRYTGFRPADFNGLNAPVTITFTAPDWRALARIEIPVIDAIPDDIPLKHIHYIVKEFHRLISYLPALPGYGEENASSVWVLPSQNQRTGIMMNLMYFEQLPVTCLIFSLLLKRAMENVLSGKVTNGRGQSRAVDG